MKKLHIEGWRFINHSYALVNQHQMLALLRRDDVDLSFHELPLFNSEWERSETGLGADSIKLLEDVPDDPDGADATLRLGFPYDLAPDGERSTFVFGTSEFSALHSSQIKDGKKISDLVANSDVQIVTPSKWSKQGFINSGVAENRVHIVPHAVDVNNFYPNPTMDRKGTRERLGATDENFLFLNIGAMTTNKGIEQLLTAFVRHRRDYPKSLLILKGQDQLYGSGGKLNSKLQAVADSEGVEIESILEGLRYIGSDLGIEKMADLYRSADAYVSPYLAEGFNIPVLEAVASGLPVIVTNGGPTDDFCNDDFSLKIESQLADYVDDRQFLNPNIESLLRHMEFVQSDYSFRERSAIAGPKWVQENFTWDTVVERLVSVIL